MQKHPGLSALLHAEGVFFSQEVRKCNKKYKVIKNTTFIDTVSVILNTEVDKLGLLEQKIIYLQPKVLCKKSHPVLMNHVGCFDRLHATGLPLGCQLLVHRITYH